MATTFLLFYKDNETERRRHMRSAQMAPTSAQMAPTFIAN